MRSHLIQNVFDNQLATSPVSMAEVESHVPSEVVTKIVILPIRVTDALLNLSLKNSHSTLDKKPRFASLKLPLVLGEA